MNTENKRNVIKLKHKILWNIFKYTLLLLGVVFFNIENASSQNLVNANDESCNNKISDFTSLDVTDLKNDETLVLPSTHTFQKLFKADEVSFPFKNNFAGYVSHAEDIRKGYLFISNGYAAGFDLTQLQPDGIQGGVAVLEIEYSNVDKEWDVNSVEHVDFSTVGGISKNSTGVVTPWGTVISGEEHDIKNSTLDQTTFGDYYKYGWNVEIDMINKTAKKLYEMGRFVHENSAIHCNKRTVYHGTERGYLFKFVANIAEDLTSGDLYVYKADTKKCEGTGRWLKLVNKSPGDITLALVGIEINNPKIKDVTGDDYAKGSNNVMKQASELGATIFEKIEDVEIGSDGKIYIAEEDGHIVSHFEDTDPLGLKPDQSVVNFLGVHVAGYADGNTVLTECEDVYNVPWKGKPNCIQFDNEGNLFIAQTGVGPIRHTGIWMVEKGHTIDNPKVKLMAKIPLYLTPTGITFSPDNRFMFLSFERNNNEVVNNNTLQNDAKGDPIKFNRSITLVIARKEHLGTTTFVLGCTDDSGCNFNATATGDDCSCIYPNSPCDDGNPNTFNDAYNQNCVCQGEACTEEKDININAISGESLQNLYISSQSIHTQVTASNEVDVIIRCGESVDLKSNHITLNEGFKVEAGACLNAKIEPCTQ